MNESGYKYPLTLATCSWGQLWDPPQLDPCVATSCQVKLYHFIFYIEINVSLKVVPFPDPDTGLIYRPENENSISFTSEFLVYNPKLKYTMNFPGIDFCGDNGGVMLLVGTFPAVRKNSS